MRVNIFSFHLCSGKLIPIYYVNILILVYIFSFLFKILFNFNIYFFLFGHCMRATSTVKLSPLSYFANTTDEMRNVMPVSPILLTKCYVVPTSKR